MKTGAGLVFLCVVLFAWAAQAGSPVPDTGQTTCYDDAGTEIDCDGTGQDGEFSINPHSYESISSGGDNMVKDNVTGLIWEVKTIDNKGDTYTWYDSDPNTNGGDEGTAGAGTDTEDFINEMNATAYGGYSDWRLPTIEELSTIVDAERSDPAIDTGYFPNTVSIWYWSSSSSASNPSLAWGVNFYDGDVYGSGKSSYGRVRAVRGGQ